MFPHPVELAGGRARLLLTGFASVAARNDCSMKKPSPPTARFAMT
jgi:hypothetical protein